MNAFTKLSFAALFAASSLAAQDAKLSVIHGIPGLPAPVEVFADGNKLFSFSYGQVKGPLSLKAGTYKIEVKLQGKTVLSASPTVAAGTSYTAIANLKATTGIQLSLYVNDLKAAERGEGRIAVRHNAMAPAVDVLVRTFRDRDYAKLVAGLENPKEAVADVDASYYLVKINPKDSSTTVFRSALYVAPGYFTGVHAVGEVGERNFRLITTRFRLGSSTTIPKLAGLVRGKTCGGKIALSTKTPEFGKSFDISMTGGAKSSVGFLHMGASDSRLFFLRLPITNFLRTGCTLYQSTESIRPIRTDDMGAVTRSMTIPSSLAFRFNEVHFQYSYIDGRSLKLTDYASIEKQ